MISTISNTTARRTALTPAGSSKVIRSMLSRTTTTTRLGNNIAIPRACCLYSNAREYNVLQDAASRLHEVLEEYRQAHYTQELPMRFKKEIVQAACRACTQPKDSTDMSLSFQQQQEQQQQQRFVRLEGLYQVLCNIGMNDRLSHVDLQVIFEKEGNERGAIPVDRLVQIL